MEGTKSFFACLLVLAVGAAPTIAAQPMIGREAPGFSLPTLAGDTVSLSDWSGKLVILHFGAGW